MRAAELNPRRGQHDRVRFVLEVLDSRILLDAGGQFHPSIVLPQGPSGVGPAQFPSPIGYTPAQVRKAYGIDSISINGIVGDGSGQTIAIVDAYDWPTAFDDLHRFDQQFGLPDPPSFTKLNQFGQASPLPGTDPAGAGNPNGTWEMEEALDVEWVHAIAPMANIILVEANSAFSNDLIDTAVATAKNLPGVSVVSMSFGGDETDGLDQLENDIFTTPAGHNGVTFLASTGDDGQPGGYPAYSPNVVAVGGTSLFLNGDDSYASESGWSGSGGGISTFEPKPPYQSALPYNFRSIPDVSFVADPETGVAIYDSYDFGATTPWEAIGGTSLACPCWAGLIAIVNQERVAFGDSILDGPTQTLPLLYSLPSGDFHDITTGNNGFPAGPGYDLVTGLGTPIAPAVVLDMTPLPLKVTPTPITNAMEGIALNDVQVGQFTDASGLQATSSYTGTVDWGDGTQPSTVSIIDLQNGSYGIVATHTFLEEGSYTITINISGPNGVIGESSDIVQVVDAPLTGLNGFTINMTEGQTFNALVGSFLDGNIFAPITDFTADISWGDGNDSIGTVRANGTTQGRFDVFGSNIYIAAGTYPVQITIHDVGGSMTVITGLAIVADAPLTSVGQSITTTEGTPFSGSLATFTDGNTFSTAGSFTALIDWGDGTADDPDVTTGVISPLGNGVFTVSGTHTYAEFGNYPLTVTISDEGGSSTATQATAKVADAKLIAGSIALTSIAGQPLVAPSDPPPVIGSFTDGNALGTLADFGNTVTVDWGDGSTSTGQLKALAAAVFDILATHTYKQAGTYTITIPIADGGGSSVTVTSTVTVNDAPITPSSATVNGVEGHDITPSGQSGTTVATFEDANPFELADDVSATIDWGDGSSQEPDTSPGMISQPGGPGSTFNVLGSHAYTFTGTYTITVTIVTAGGTTATITSTATITDAPLTGAISHIPSLVAGSTFSGQVATLTDGNPLGTESDFIVPITWGDGHTSIGTLTALGDGKFSISSENQYETPGTYSFIVKVVDIGGSNLTLSGTVTVLDAPIVPVTGTSLSTTEGSTFSGMVASFNNSPTASASSFSAVINWGDGNTTTGQIVSLGQGLFGVNGTNIYKQHGSYPVSVSIQDEFGSSATVDVTANVNDAELVATGSDHTAVLGQGFTGVVAQLNDANPYSSATDFTAQITWGDGHVSIGQVVPLGNGRFQVIGTNTFSSADSKSVSVAISGDGGNTASAKGTIQVLSPLVGGVSTSLITSDNTPQFSGTAQPDTSIQLFAIPISTPDVRIPIGGQRIGSSGTWSIGGTTLPDDQYAILGLMFDASGQPLQGVNLLQSQALIVDTTGPTVKGAQFDPAQGVLRITLHDSGSGLNPAQMVNAANLSFQSIGRTEQNVPVRSITLQPGAPGSGDITEVVSLALGRPANTYVLTLNANGLTDRAGNTLVETSLVTFPQTTNSPNPNYVAQFTVSGGQASGPELYVSAAEQLAAARYVNFSRFNVGRSRPNLAFPRANFAFARPNLAFSRPNPKLSQLNARAFRFFR